MSLVRVSDQVQQKSGCTATEDGKRLEILYLEVMGFYCHCSENKDADQLHDYCMTDLCLCMCR